MHRPKSEFSGASAFIVDLCVDAEGDIQLAAGGRVFEVPLAEDDTALALREISIGSVDAMEFGPWESFRPE
jgi:hypothetical protein